MIKAIETHYKGYRFRSRLEARWAVFFDTIGIEYQYEPEGYVVDGIPYLPDFWVPVPWNPSHGYFLEIKPSDIDEQKIDFFYNVAKLSGHRVQVVCGNPWPGEHKVFSFCHHHHRVPEKPHIVGYIASSDGNLVLRNTDMEFVHEEPFVLCDKYQYLYEIDETGIRKNVDSYDVLDKLVPQAFSAARSARFEHGEKPIHHWAGGKSC